MNEVNELFDNLSADGRFGRELRLQETSIKYGSTELFSAKRRWTLLIGLPLEKRKFLNCVNALETWDVRRYEVSFMVPGGYLQLNARDVERAGRAPRPPRKGDKFPDVQILLPAKYSHEFPVRQGHN